MSNRLRVSPSVFPAIDQPKLTGSWIGRHVLAVGHDDRLALELHDLYGVVCVALPLEQNMQAPITYGSFDRSQRWRRRPRCQTCVVQGRHGRNHRIKNLFSVTAGLISLSAQTSTSVDELAVELRSRLQSLARAHDLTLPDLGHNGATDAATTVVTLMKAILAPHEHAQASRIAITGSDAPLSSKALTSFALLLHELTTNAAKYGALSSPTGRLTIDIVAIDALLHVKWEERGSTPSAETSVREGFGTTLEKAVLKGGQSRHELDLAHPTLIDIVSRSRAKMLHRH